MIVLNRRKVSLPLYRRSKTLFFTYKNILILYRPALIFRRNVEGISPLKYVPLIPLSPPLYCLTRRLMNKDELLPELMRERF